MEQDDNGMLLVLGIDKRTVGFIKQNVAFGLSGGGWLYFLVRLSLN